MKSDFDLFNLLLSIIYVILFIAIKISLPIKIYTQSISIYKQFPFAPLVFAVLH